jgi:hypothetical protein
MICQISTYAQFNSGLFANCIYFDDAKQVEDCENLQIQDYFDSEILPFLKDIKKEGNKTKYYTYFYIDPLGSVIDLEILDISKSEEQIIMPIKFPELSSLPKVSNVIAKENHIAAFTCDFDKNNFLIGKYSYVVAAKDEFYKVVQFTPRFPGCEDLPTQKEKKSCADAKMLEYIYSNLKYSEEAINKKVNNGLVIQFIIETDGYITDINVVRDIGYGCGQSAIDVVESMNHMEESWIPGSQYGRKVRVKYTLPIKFNVSNRAGFDNENEVVDTESIEINNNKEYIYQSIEDMPFFPACPNEKNRKLRKSCGDAAMLQFVYKNIKTPLGSFDETDSRRVRAFFVVEKDGSLTNINVTGDTDNGVGEMIKEVIEKMNEMKERWIPGNVAGKIVRAQYELPINMRKE